jgi:hypothetical protein
MVVDHLRPVEDLHYAGELYPGLGTLWTLYSGAFVIPN